MIEPCNHEPYTDLKNLRISGMDRRNEWSTPVEVCRHCKVVYVPAEAIKKMEADKAAEDEHYKAIKAAEDERRRIVEHLFLKGRMLIDEGELEAGRALVGESSRIEGGGRLAKKDPEPEPPYEGLPPGHNFE